MTMQGRIVADSATCAWDDATEAANAWRGRCIASFARAEAEVTETLLTLSQASSRGMPTSLPMLVGQRYAALTKLVDVNGPFSTESGKVIERLAALQGRSTLRNMLCHGNARITLDRYGRWMLVLRQIALREGRVDRSDFVVDERDAPQLADDLNRDVQRLAAELARLRDAVAPAERGVARPRKVVDTIS